MKQQMREENECPLKKYKVCVIVIERLVNKFENVSLNSIHVVGVSAVLR